MKNIQSGRKCLLALLLMLLTVFSAGCGTSEVTRTEGNLKIVLSSDYQKGKMKGTNWYYQSAKGPNVLGIRTAKDDLEKKGEEIDSVSDYAVDYIKANHIRNVSGLTEKDDSVSFQYHEKISGTGYSYLCYIFDHNDEYWLVNFSCYSDVYSRNQKSFEKAAESITFTD